ncbi:hypothetical protein DOT_3157 [Desulfosporosinus sp. OT]|nr:hypothetical protein DOT_3157 [Desulfosporosinus sp. OT]
MLPCCGRPFLGLCKSSLAPDYLNAQKNKLIPAKTEAGKSLLLNVPASPKVSEESFVSINYKLFDINVNTNINNRPIRGGYGIASPAKMEAGETSYYSIIHRYPFYTKDTFNYLIYNS